MSAVFRVRVLHFAVLQEIEGARSSESYGALLDAMEFGDRSGMSDAELREMCLMSLQDLEPAEAAEHVLQLDLGDRLKPGQIRNHSHEMQDEKLWEESADLGLHEALFNAASLLYQAFPSVFPEPDAVRVKLEVVALGDAGRKALTPPLPESLLVRLLADGMEERAALHRLFREALAGPSFPEADKIVWIVESEAVDPSTINLQVISSGYWLDALRHTKSYESNAYADTARPAADRAP